MAEYNQPGGASELDKLDHAQLLDLYYKLSLEKSFSTALDQVLLQINNWLQGAAAVAVIFKEDGKKEFETVWAGPGSANGQIEPELARQAALENQPVLDNTGGKAALSYAVAAPLGGASATLGGLAVYRSDEAQPFIEEDRNLLAGLGQRLGPILERIREGELLVQAVQARDDFLSVATHDLRNPLSSLRGFAQLTQRTVERVPPDQPLPREKIQTNLLRLVRQTDNINDLIEKMLDFSRILSHRFELAQIPLDLVALVKELVPRFQNWVSDQERGSDPARMHTIELELNADNLEGNFDQARITQLISSLMHNAVKYSPDGGQVRVRLLKQDGQANLTVQDSGMGIAAEKENAVFESWRWPRTPQQTGLGVSLFVGQEIVRRHGGQLSFQSVPSQGTTFILSLPLHSY